MSDELDRPRIYLTALENEKLVRIDDAKRWVRDRIERLEAEADPWTDEKECVDSIEKGEDLAIQWQLRLARYVRHLEAENARLKAENDAMKSEPHADENGHMVFPDEKADPWVDAREMLKKYKIFTHDFGEFRPVGLYVHDIEARNATLKARIAELESRPVPPLNPKTVIATACRLIAKQMPTPAGYIMQRFQAGNAGIYPLAGDEK